MEATFNLISEPWIPLRSAKGGTRSMTLREALGQAHEWQDIDTGSPLEDAALLRLLMAIVLRVLHPEDHEELAELIEMGSFPSKAFEEYFGKWGHRFDLFDEENPFYQCVDGETRKANPVTTAKLSHALASGNNATLFDHSLDDSPLPLTPAQAARLLVATQNFALGGGVSKPFNFSHAPLADGYMSVLKGDSLFTTLCLNLAGFVEPPAGHDPVRDIPCWEKNAPVNPKKRYPWGWLDHLTWQSRRVLLDRTDGKVTAIRMLQGDAPLKDPVPFEPAFAHQCRDKAKGFLPLKLRQDRALWRDLDSLIASYSVDDTQTRAPGIVEKLHDLMDYCPEQENSGIAMDIYGMCTDQAKVFFWQHQRFPLPVAYLNDESLWSRLHRSLTLAEGTARTLSRATWFLARFLLESDTSDKEPDKKAVTARTDMLSTGNLFWNSIEEPFLGHYRKIPADGEGAMENWGNILRTQARQAFAEAGKKLSGNSRELKAFARAETILLGKLKKNLNG